MPRAKGKASVRKAAKPPAKKPTPARKAGAKRGDAAKPAFGRPGTAGKAEGDDAVKAWLDGVKPEHQEMVRKLDALIGRELPGVRRAIKWSMPLYGLPGQGWIA